MRSTALGIGLLSRGPLPAQAPGRPSLTAQPAWRPAQPLPGEGRHRPLPGRIQVMMWERQGDCPAPATGRLRDMSRNGKPGSGPPGLWLRGDEQRAWLAYIRVQLRLAYEMNRQLQADSDLSLADYDVLAALSAAPGGYMQVTALAAQLGWDAAGCLTTPGAWSAAASCNATWPPPTGGRPKSGSPPKAARRSPSRPRATSPSSASSSSKDCPRTSSRLSARHWKPSTTNILKTTPFPPPAEASPRPE